MTQRLADLKRKCEKLGYTVHRAGLRPAKSDYLAVLRQHFINQDFPEGLPYNELTPMLCAEYHRLLPKAQDQIWKDGNGWICQEKLNGERAILHFVAGVGVFCHSRVVSTVNYRRCEWTDRLKFKEFVPGFTATIDTELVSPMFHAFDITRWGGLDLRKKQLCERLAFLGDFKTEITTAGLQEHFDFPAIHFNGKKEVYDGLISKGREGAVLKNLNSTYADSNVRIKNGWVKVKKKVEFDCYVCGYEQGKASSRYHDRVACLIFGVKTEEGLRVVAKVANLPSKFRRDVSLYNAKTGQVELRLDVKDRVATVSGMEISRKAKRLSHPKLIRWRGDLTPEDCLYSTNDIKGDASELPLRRI
jgi:ATP-dependent DNA ligase